MRRDGSVLDADARLDVERDDAGRPLRYTVTIRDSSVRRRLEALRARWELLFRATSRGIAVTDPASGLLEAVNPAWAAMHGGVEADFVGATVAAALTPAAAARLPEVTATLAARADDRLRVRARAAGRLPLPGRDRADGHAGRRGRASPAG